MFKMRASAKTPRWCAVFLARDAIWAGYFVFKHHSYPTDRILTHWGRVTHICVSKLTIIGSDNGLSPDRRQAIFWTNAGLLLIGPLGTKFSEILIEILTFSFKKMRLKVSSAKRWPFCLGLNVLRVMRQEGTEMNNGGAPVAMIASAGVSRWWCW